MFSHLVCLFGVKFKVLQHTELDLRVSSLFYDLFSDCPDLSFFVLFQIMLKENHKRLS